MQPNFNKLSENDINNIVIVSESKNEADITMEGGNLKMGEPYYYDIILIKKLDPKAIIPTYAYQGDAGMDLYCFNDFTIEARSSKIIDTQIAIEIPPGCYGRIASRSGLSIKHKIEVGAGVIDSKYRGEIKVHLYNHSDDTFIAYTGSKIAQLILTTIVIPRIIEASELSETDRGNKGFGSSGL